MIDSAKAKAPAINVGAQKVASIYAQALLGAATEGGRAAEVVEELNTFVSQALDPSPDLQAVLSSALISYEDKSALLDRVFASRLSPALLDFLKVVARHGRLEIVREIAVEATKQFDIQSGRVRVRLQTAAPVDGRVSQSLAASLRNLLGGEPQLEAEVDPKLIGGVVLRVGDTVYDGSVAWQLEQAREQMITRSVHEIQSRRDRLRPTGGN